MAQTGRKINHNGIRQFHRILSGDLGNRHQAQFEYRFLNGPCFRATRPNPSFQNGDILPAHLAQPGGRHKGAGFGVVNQHKAAVQNADIFIRCLDQLPARRMMGTGYMPCLIFLYRAYIQQIGCTIDFCAPCVDRIPIQPFYTEMCPYFVRGGPCPIIRCRIWFRGQVRVATGAFQPGQHPSHCAILQRHNRIGDPCIDEGLCANDRASSPGAIYNNGRCWIGRDGFDTMNQFRARHINPPRYG